MNKGSHSVSVRVLYCSVSEGTRVAVPECLHVHHFSSLALRLTMRFSEVVIQARAVAAVPSPLCCEKHRNAAHRNAEQPMNTVRRYSGINTKFRN